MPRTALLLISLFAGGCGIKAPPRPPLPESAPAPATAPAPSDAGCCGSATN